MTFSIIQEYQIKNPNISHKPPNDKPPNQIFMEEGPMLSY